MKKEDLLKLIESYPDNTNFFVRGQGLQEGFPVPGIAGICFKDVYGFDTDYIRGRYSADPYDVILEATT